MNRQDRIEQDRRARDIFLRAIEIVSPEARAAFLEGACGQENELRSRVNALLDNARPDSFLEDPALQFMPASEKQGEKIGRYKLLQKIGEGGMGVVYMAEQEQPVRRRVALKIIKLGMDTKQVVARFEAERQALALMDHPNIARVLDGGATDAGRPYFVMELVLGVPITEFCDKNQLSTEKRLKLFLSVCQAIQSAHQKGIIHRDLKPSNILVTLNPDGSGLPKVIDFGVAKAINQKLTEKTVFTNYAAMVGTPAYMSPEQAEMSHLDVDTRSDIYGLGVLLYELLTGTTPFPEKRLRNAGYNEMQRIILHEEPERPSTRLSTLQGEQRSVVARNRGANEVTLGRAFPSDLDWIVMKCLEKDRARRYETANGLARDLERLLHDEPVVARPPSAAYRVQKFVRRNRLAVSAATAVAAVLLLGVLASTWQAIRATQSRKEAQADEQRALAAQASEARERRRAVASEQAGQRLLYAARMGWVQAAWEQNQVARVRQLLEETASYPDRGFEWYYWQRQTHIELHTLRGHLDQVWAVAFSGDGKRIVTGSKDQTAKVWDAASGIELLTLTGHLSVVSSVAFSPDSRRIVTGSLDATAIVWDATNGRRLLTLKGHHSDIWGATFSPDGLRIATGSTDRTAKVWDALSGRLLLTLEGHTLDVATVAFSSDGMRIATASDDRTVKIWDANTGKGLLTLRGHTAPIFGVAFSPNGRRVVTGSNDRSARVWDTNSGKEILSLMGHEGHVFSVAYSPDGERIASVSEDRTARMWDALTGKPLATFKGHGSEIWGLAFSPDGRRIVTASYDQTAKVWDASGDLESLALRGHDGEVLTAAFSDDGERVITGGKDQTARIWETRSGKPLLTVTGYGAPVLGAAFSPDGRLIATASGETVRFQDAAGGSEQVLPTGHSALIKCLAFSPDGRRMVSTSADHSAKVWEMPSHKCLFTLRGHTDNVFSAAFSSDGSRIITGSNDGTARVWDAADGRLLSTVRVINTGVSSAHFSPDGKRILTSSGDQTAAVWDSSTGTNLLTLKGHSEVLSWADYSPDGRRVVTSSWDHSAKLWDAVSGEELLTLKGHTMGLNSATFARDGRRILTCSADPTARIWQAASMEEVTRWQSEEKEASGRLALALQARAATAEQERNLRAQDPANIDQWLVLGPLQNQTGAAALDQEQVPNEATLAPRPGEWRPVRLYGSPFLDFDTINRVDERCAVAYAVAYIWSQAQQTDLSLKVGSDDEARIYLNGKEIYRRAEPRVYVPDQDEVTNVVLKAGLNVLLLKAVIDEDEMHDWRCSVCFADAAGQPIKGIRATITPAFDLEPGAIHEWLILAPIRFGGTNGATALAQEQIPGEAHLRPRAGVPSRNNGTNLVWQEFHLDDYGLDFLKLTGQTNADCCAAYGVCYVESDASQTNLILKVGSDDQAKVYLNGKEVYRYDGPDRALVPDQDQVRDFVLRPGINPLVFKVVNGKGEWRGSIRFTDAGGQPAKGLRVTLTPP